MANYFKYLSPKRSEPRSSETEAKVWYKSDLSFRLALGFVFILITLLLFPRAESLKFADFKEGSISNEEVIAPFTFRVQKNPDVLARERQDAKSKVLPVFTLNDSVLTNALGLLSDLRDSLHQAAQQSLSDSAVAVSIERILRENKIILTRDLIPFFIGPSREVEKVKKGTGAADRQEFFAHLEKILKDIYVIGIINTKKSEIPNISDKIVIQSANEEQERSVNSFYEQAEAEQRLIDRLRVEFGENSDSVRVGYAMLEVFLGPNLFLDSAETERRIEEAVAQVPLVKGRILSGERIIDNHERITAEHADVLSSLAQSIREREQKSGLLSQILVWVGECMLIICTLVPFVLFLYFHRFRVWNDRRMLFIFGSSMLFVVVTAYLVLQYGLPKYLIPFAIVPMIVTSYQDTRSGFFVGFSISLLVGAQFGFDYELTLVGMVVSAASIVAFGFSKYRKRLVNATLILGLAYILGITAVGIIKYVSLNDLGNNLMAALGAAILSPILAYGFIMLFDFVFDVASEFKLIELSDLNNPLLKMISLRAPGSYHHSLQVSNLTEAAAEAIGANALLAKVGAYYHDIGKMFMPEYFVENQLGGKNPHDRLSPRLSSLILINHVRKGYEFARQNNLPSIVCDFILEHHGNSLMKFFYQKAKESAKDKDLEILESDFRYPGNRPRSRETGIMMLADSVEAMIRSIKEPTLGKIKNAVRNLVEDKVQSGDLDECPLTVSELAIIVDTFSNILMGIHHERIEYPNQKKMINKPSKVMVAEV